MSTDETKQTQNNEEVPKETETETLEEENSVETEESPSHTSNNDGREDEEREVEDEESPIYKNTLPNRVIVTTNGRNSRRRAPRLQFYVDRARRILRSDNTVTVTGLGQAISMACTLVEVLKRQKIVEIQSVRTSVDVEPSFAGQRLLWGRPTPSIRFVLRRGPHATYVSDYHQRKVIEIFENNDTTKSGKLDKKTVLGLNMGKSFFANEEQIEKADSFINEINEETLNLPNFIKYASILIHPLLKDKMFKEQLKIYGISSQDTHDTVQTVTHEEDGSEH